MMPPAPSLTDASSSAVTVGPRQSGLTINTDRALPSFLVGRLQAEPAPVVSPSIQSIPYISPWLVVGAVVLAAGAIAWLRS